MGKPSAPVAPNPVVTAQAQTASNQATATAQSELNNINQTTPYGSSTYTQNGTYADGTPIWSQQTTLSPAQQNLLDMTQQGETTLGQTALAGLGNLQNTFGTPFSFGGPNVSGSVANSGDISTSLPNSGNVQAGVDTSGVPQLQGNVQGAGSVQSGLNLSGQPGMQSNVSNQYEGGITGGITNQSNAGITGQIGNGANSPYAIQQAENAAYNQQTQYLNPQFAQGQQSLNAQLANEGLTSGDKGYDNAQQQFGQQENQAYGNAGNQAVLAGQNEQNTLYGQGLSSANLQNSANAQGFSQGLAGSNLQNSANAQGYSQGLSSADLANTTNQQAYNQALGTGQFQNTAQAQQYGQNLSSGQFQNAANQQGIQNLLSLGQFNNSAQNQQFNQNLAAGGYQNTAQAQQYGQNLSNAQLNNSASAQALQQQLALYNQPLNQYNALASGAQVTAPQFGQTNPATMAGTNTAGITNNAYQNQLQAYQTQMAGVNNLFGLGGTLGAAAIMA